MEAIPSVATTELAGSVIPTQFEQSQFVVTDRPGVSLPVSMATAENEMLFHPVLFSGTVKTRNGAIEEKNKLLFANLPSVELVASAIKSSTQADSQESPEYFDPSDPTETVQASGLATRFVSDFAQNPAGNIQASIKATPTWWGSEISLRYAAKPLPLLKTSVTVYDCNTGAKKSWWMADDLVPSYGQPSLQYGTIKIDGTNCWVVFPAAESLKIMLDPSNQGDPDVWTLAQDMENWPPQMSRDEEGELTATLITDTTVGAEPVTVYTTVSFAKPSEYHYISVGRDPTTLRLDLKEV